jgi:hypothetical protein
VNPPQHTHRDCKANELLATVPTQLLMNFDSAKAGALGSHLAPLKPWLALAVHLLHERSLGDQSAWAPYLAVLPDQLELPMFWYTPVAASSERTLTCPAPYFLRHSSLVPSAEQEQPCPRPPS